MKLRFVAAILEKTERPPCTSNLEKAAFPVTESVLIVAVPATPRLPVLEELPSSVGPDTVKLVSVPVTPPSVPGLGIIGGMLIGMSG